MNKTHSPNIGMLLAALLCANIMTTPSCTMKVSGKHPPTFAPPKASTLTLKKDITGAHSDTKSAQENVRIGKAEADKAGVITASEPLETADGQLNDALAKLEDAMTHNGELETAIKVRDDHQAAELAAAQTKLDEANKTIALKEKRISDLENEALRKAKLQLSIVGAALLLAMAGCIAAFFFLGFTAGIRVGIICGVVGAASITLATMLTQIVFWMKITFAVLFVAAIGYAVWHLYHHIPTKTFGFKDHEPNPA